MKCTRNFAAEKEKAPDYSGYDRIIRGVIYVRFSLVLHIAALWYDLRFHQWHNYSFSDCFSIF